jgi:transposase-like protein
MATRKRVPMSEGKKNIIAGLIQEYDIQSAADIQEALKGLLGGTIQDMMEAEMDEHLGYEPYERSDKANWKKAYNRTRAELPT